MNVGSLFSGVGGLERGLELAGMTILWQVEKDPKARAVLRYHWPDTIRHEDVCDVGRATLPPVDLICGGFPCQDLSLAGRRAGLDGARSGLWHEFRRIVGELLPRWVLVENVPGLRSSPPDRRGRDLAVIVSGLAELGYVGSWRSLDSQYLGVAQRRQRVFLLALRDPRAGCPAEILALAEGLSGNPAPRRTTGQRVADSLTVGANQTSGRPEDVASSDEVVGTLDANDGPYWDGSDVTDTLFPVVMEPLPFNETQITHRVNRSNPKPGDPSPSLAANARPPAVVFKASSIKVGSARDIPATTAGVAGFDPGQWAAKKATTQYTPDGAPPLMGHGRTSVTAAIPRRLTPRECERLQGWPDDWTLWGRDEEGNVFQMKDGPRYRMIGNGVTTTVAHWIGRRIMAAEAEP